MVNGYWFVSKLLLLIINIICIVNIPRSYDLHTSMSHVPLLHNAYNRKFVSGSEFSSVNRTPGCSEYTSACPVLVQAARTEVPRPNISPVTPSHSSWPAVLQPTISPASARPAHAPAQTPSLSSAIIIHPANYPNQVNNVKPKRPARPTATVVRSRPMSPSGKVTQTPSIS